MNREEFITSIKKLGIQVTEEKLNQLDTYLNTLIEYNKHTNLTAITNIEDIYLKHFYDSLTLVNVIDLNEVKTFLDIGSGAGFPGLVIKIFYPHLHVYLVDSNNKKTKFLELIKEKLLLDNLVIINNRIENLYNDYLNYFDVVTARAVTNMSILVELALPFVKKNNYFIAMKGSNKEEIITAKYAITKMQGSIELIEEFNLPNNGGIRNLIKIKKEQETNKEDLRAYDKIVKKPLKLIK